VSVIFANQVNLSTSNKNSSDADQIDPHMYLESLAWLQEVIRGYSTSQDESASTSDDNIHDTIIRNYAEGQGQSRSARKVVGRKNRFERRRINQKAIKKNKKPIKTFVVPTEGIEGSELRR